MLVGVSVLVVVSSISVNRRLCMSDILLIIVDNSCAYLNQRKGISSLLTSLFPLDKIFYKSKMIDNINNNLVETNINSINHINNNGFYNSGYASGDNNQYSGQKVFLIKVPKKYLDEHFYGRKGIKKAYNAKKLIVDKINLFCDEEGIKMHFYSNKLKELCQIEFQKRLASGIHSEVLLFEDSIFGTCNNGNNGKNTKNGKKYFRKKYCRNGCDKKYGELFNDFQRVPINLKKIGNINLGKMLFRSLTLEIIDIVCNYKKIQLIQSEVTIVGNKKNKDNVLAMAWKLSQQAKHITIITSDKDTDWIETETEEIYNNTGLVINTSNNYKSVVISSEVLINYGNVFELSTYEGLKRRTVIINNSLNDFSPGSEKIRIRNPLINKIEIEFPRDFSRDIKALAPEHFSTSQLAEIILGSRNGWIEDKIRQSFKKEGFRIKKLLGSNLDSIM